MRNELRISRTDLAVIALVAAAAMTASGVTSPAQARTWRVPSEAPTIQAGIDSSAAGDTILVADGMYSGEGNYNINYSPGSGITRDLVVRSEHGSAWTTVDVQGSPDNPRRGFFFGTNETAASVLEGFTILNGYMSTAPSLRGERTADPQHDLSAGGVKVQTSDPVLRDLVVLDCESEFTGGGISIEIGANPRLEEIVIRGCVAGIQGGGLSIETGAAPVVVDCEITGNFSAAGGGVHVDANPTFVNCLIAANWSLAGGGIQASGFANIDLERTIVWGNCASLQGAQVYSEASGRMDFECSLVDSSGVVVGKFTSLEYGETTRFVDPLFCSPESCDSAPNTRGHYAASTASPAQPESSPCGEVIGDVSRGCLIVPTRATSWGAIKTLFR